MDYGHMTEPINPFEKHPNQERDAVTPIPRLVSTQFIRSAVRYTTEELS